MLKAHGFRVYLADPPMIERFLPCLAALFASVILSSCIEEYQGSGSGLSGSLTGGTSGTAPETSLSKHDVALRFLTAFIRLDRNMAMKYATPEAVSKLNWNAPHRGNIPYFDDKMILQFNGGWARVYFQDVGNTYKIVDFDVHRR